MVRSLAPMLLAGAVGLLPFTVFNTSLVDISRATEHSAAATGSLRGLGAVAALVIGLGLAPLLDRVRKHWLAAASLVLLAVATLLGALGSFWSIAVLSLLVGAGTAVLNPAVAAAAADKYGDGPAAARAATLVTATTSMTAMLAAPLLALPALLWDWQGNLIAVAVVSLVLAAVFYRVGVRSGPPEQVATRPSYLASFRALSGKPGVLPVLTVSLLRTAAFMGYLAYIAAYYDYRFHFSSTTFALVWTLSGASFFFGNLLTGRWVKDGRTRPFLLGGLTAAILAMLVLFFTGTLVVALLCTSVLGFSHAAVAACVTTLLVQRAGDQRGGALSLNGVAQSLGTFLGASLGGTALAAAPDFSGVAWAFGAVTLGALVLALTS
ncbi:MFS transporter [Pseudonocardiaceae bacterium YIM PH 21723]|nr:MFS transporter [Pseudonocardiaceae bacterium YIM PH 21723]